MPVAPAVLISHVLQDTIKEPKAVPAKTLNATQFEQLLAHVTARKHGDPLRTRVVILATFKAGLRCAEVCNLDWSDVTDAEGHLASTLTVRPIKYATRARTIPVHPALRQALEALHGAAGRPAAGPVIPAADGSRMVSNTLQRALGRLYAEAGFVGVSSHSGRRSFISTLATANPGRLRAISHLAGHADPGTTVLYCGADADAVAMIAGL